MSQFPCSQTQANAAGNFAMTPALFKSLPFEPAKDFEMISMIGSFGFVLAVDAKAQMKDAADFIAQAKANPAKLSIATISVGSAQFLAAEVFRSMAKIDVTIIPYKTAWWREVIEKAKIEKQ